MHDVLVFGHLSIHGAKQNNSSKHFEGVLKPNSFTDFKCTFSGHFHTHQFLLPNLLYVGAPTQFNFSDADMDRGIIIYDSDKHNLQYIKNANCHRFVQMPEAEMERILQEDPNYFAGKHVRVVFNNPKPLLYLQNLRTKLLQFGAQDFSKKILLEKLFNKKSKDHLKHQQNIEALIVDFVESVKQKLPKELEKTKEMVNDRNDDLLKEGLSIVSEVNQVQGNVIESQSIFPADLHSITIENFMGVQGSITIEFASLLDGIYVIEGTNGSGKSTLFEAFVWCHFGEFLRSGMLKANAINDKAKECRVRVTYKSGFGIERTKKGSKPEDVKTFQTNFQNPDSETYLPQNEKGELRNSQKRINNIIGIDFQTFSKSVVLGQNIVANFLTGSSLARREIIEEMLGLEKFNFYHETAKQRRIVLDEKINSLGNELKAIQSKTQRNEYEIETLQSKIQGFEGKLSELGNKRALLGGEDVAKPIQDDEEENIKSQMKQLQDEVQQKQVELARFNEETMKVSVGQLQSELSELKRLEGALENNQETPTLTRVVPRTSEEGLFPYMTWILRVVVRVLAIRLERIDQYLEKPNCLPQFEMTKLRQLLGEDLRGMEHDRLACLTKIQQKEKVLEKDIGSLLSYRNLKHEISDLEATLMTLSLKKSQFENIALRHQNALTDIEVDLRPIQTQIQFHQEVINQYKDEIREMESKSESIQNELNQLYAQFEINKFWEMAFDKKSKSGQGFSTMRSFLLDESLVELNSVFEFYLDLMAMGYPSGLVATMNSDLELDVTYGKLSGGERKRIDLALLFALFEMVRTRSHYHPQFIMLDEVFDALDKEGRTAVKQVLIGLAQKLPKVFVITHTDIASGLSVAGMILVKMKMNGTVPQGTEIEIGSA